MARHYIFSVFFHQLVDAHLQMEALSPTPLHFPFFTDNEIHNIRIVMITSQQVFL